MLILVLPILLLVWYVTNMLLGYFTEEGTWLKFKKRERGNANVGGGAKGLFRWENPTIAWVSLVGLLLFGVLTVLFQVEVQWLILGVLVITMACFDAKTMYIPGFYDVLLLLLMVWCIMESFIVMDYARLIQGSIGVLIAVCLLGVPVLLKQMGVGDLILFCAAGLLLGWQLTFVFLLCSCVFGILYGVVVSRVRGVSLKGMEFPFVPAIALALSVTVLWGMPLIQAYTSLFLP